MSSVKQPNFRAKVRRAEEPSQAIPHERLIVVLLCGLAALRVFLFCAAFPFFNNVDEQSHYDVVYKYSRGHVPSGLERRDPDAARIIVLYSSPEYFARPGQIPDARSPRFRWPATPDAQAELAANFRLSQEKHNHEATQPPLYYAVAGVWHRIGEWVGLGEGQALYWTRFLNVVVCVALVWVAYCFSAGFFPHRPFLWLGIPTLVAFFPQDAFYAVNNDILLPLVNGAAFLCLLFIARGDPRGFAFHAGTGLLIAAAVLVKFSSVGLLPVSAALVSLGVLRSEGGEQRKKAIAKAAVLFAAAAVPVVAWCVRNYLVSGDITGSMTKIHFLTWTLKPVTAMFDHPFFTLSGVTLFWQQTIVTFWRGEFVWAWNGIASAGWDFFYTTSSFVFIAVAMIVPAAWRDNVREDRRNVLWPSLALFLCSLGFLVAISLMYDFGECFYPSRRVPFLMSGRLVLGALIPFAALYVYGLDSLLPERLGAPVRWLVLLVPIAWMTVTEFYMSRAAFGSAYNWFHMF